MNIYSTWITKLAVTKMGPLTSSCPLACPILRLFRRLQRSVGNWETGVKPKSVSVTVAHELLQAGHRYLDVRTSEEFNAGHPPAAINIPYYHVIKNGGKEMLKNPKFVEEVSSEFGKEEKFIVGCKSGGRSKMAATDLHAAGFTHVTDVAGGYTAWKENGLPSTE